MLEDDEKAAPPPESKVPAPIARAVMRGLEKDRSKRWPTLSALVHELTPPPQRSPVKFIMFAALGALVVTGATAAVMTKTQHKPTVRIDGADDETGRLLIQELNQRDQEIKHLREVLAKGTKDREELIRVSEELEQKFEEQAEQNKKLIEVIQ